MKGLTDLDPFAVRGNLQHAAHAGPFEGRDEFADTLGEMRPAVDVGWNHRLGAEDLGGCVILAGRVLANTVRAARF